MVFHIAIVRFDPEGNCVLRAPASEWRRLVSEHGRSRAPGVRAAITAIRNQSIDGDGERDVAVDAATAKVIAALVSGAS
jgi:hypothetical protein